MDKFFAVISAVALLAAWVSVVGDLLPTAVVALIALLSFVAAFSAMILGQD